MNADTPPIQPDARNGLVQALIKAMAMRASRRRFSRDYGSKPGELPLPDIAQTPESGER